MSCSIADLTDLKKLKGSGHSQPAEIQEFLFSFRWWLESVVPVSFLLNPFGMSNLNLLQINELVEPFAGWIKAEVGKPQFWGQNVAFEMLPGNALYAGHTHFSQALLFTGLLCALLGCFFLAGIMPLSGWLEARVVSLCVETSDFCMGGE